jgi:hypothetical protein
VVTIHSRRDLPARVSKFVNQITAPENGGEGGLARWRLSVCPLVSGLPAEDGEFILERFSEIARTAQVPLASERCRPNLYILVTPEPEELLKGMEKRNRVFTFGYDTTVEGAPLPPLTPARVVDKFIATPRAARVWYNSVVETREGTPVKYCMKSDLAAELAAMGVGTPFSKNDTEAVPCSTNAIGSHLVFGFEWALSSVFVVVDQSRLRGVSRGQLADYAAMVSLAKLDPEAHLGDAQTILRLFDAAPEAAPAGLTDWDQAFLKSLYATDPSSRLQRSQISHTMVPEIAP